MSLKITVEVDGQSEQQLAPVIAQFVASHPEWLGLATPVRAPEPSPREFYNHNSALLQEQIQQLMAQNQQLQAQVASSQRLLAGVPSAPALSFSAPLVPTTDSAQDTQPPLLPERYQPSKGSMLRHWLRAPVQATAHRLGRLASWAWRGREWLLIFLLLCGGMTGVLRIAPVIGELFHPEFIDSKDGGPGATKTAKPAAESAPKEEQEKDPVLPALPTRKAGSYPAPPPAFQQQP
jgi:hypothetical protein